MKKHIWKKSFSISFVFHFIVVITIGVMVAGFHQEIQRPELITVNLADTPEQIAKAQEKSSFNSFSKDIENIFKHKSLLEFSDCCVIVDKYSLYTHHGNSLIHLLSCKVICEHCMMCSSCKHSCLCTCIKVRLWCPEVSLILKDCQKV